MEKVPLNRFINKAVVLDFRECPADQQLNAGDIQSWEEANHPLLENEAVLCNFGLDRKWVLLLGGKPYLDS